MADDDNIIRFTPRREEEDHALPADRLLEDCVGEYEEVIILGVDADGEMTVSGNIADIAQVYEMLSSAAQNIALAHLEMIFTGTQH